MTGCVVCGRPPGELGIRLDVTFQPGPLGPRFHAEVPHRAGAIDLCTACWKDNPLVRALLESGDLEPVIELRGWGCRVECTGHQRGRVRRFWSPFRAYRGIPAVGRCPVCWGPIAVEEET